MTDLREWKRNERLKKKKRYERHNREGLKEDQWQTASFLEVLSDDKGSKHLFPSFSLHQLSLNLQPLSAFDFLLFPSSSIHHDFIFSVLLRMSALSLFNIPGTLFSLFSLQSVRRILGGIFCSANEKITDRENREKWKHFILPNCEMLDGGQSAGPSEWRLSVRRGDVL